MAAYSDAFGFTPAEFMALTLPQLAAYGRYMEEKAEKMSGSAPPRPAPESSVDSLDQLIAMFGSPESKEALRARMSNGQ